MEDVRDVDEGLFSNIGNFLKGLFKQVPTDAKGTIKSLMPLFGGGNIAKALLNDLKKESLTGTSFGDTLKAITPSLNELAPGTAEKVEPPVSGGGGGAEGAATPAAGASVAADNPDFAKAVAAAVEKALGERGAGAAAAVRDIGGGTDPKKATSGLDDDTKALLKALLTRLGSDGADADPKSVVSAAAKDSGAAGGGEGGGDLKYSKYIDAEKIKKVAGDKGPKAVDSLLAGSEDLRKKLGIKDSRNREGRLVRESMFSLMFEEVDADAVKAIKTGLKKDDIGKELSDEEAKEIAQSIVDKVGGGKGEGGGDEKTLSSLLFTPIDNNDSSKGYKAKADKPGTKTSNIKMNLSNLVSTLKEIDPSGNLDKAEKINSDKRKNLMRYLGRLQDELKGVKLESKSNDNEIILERWQRLAGLKD
jgi:hypothetical protein